MSAVAEKPQRVSKDNAALSADRLREALDLVRPVVPARSPVDALTRVMLADGIIAASDGETVVRIAVDGFSIAPVLAPYARLRDIAGTLGEGDVVSFAINGQRLIVKCNGGSWVLTTVSADAFPTWRDTRGKAVARVPGDQFCAMVAAVRDSADGGGLMGGIHIDFSDGQLSFVGMNGRHMSVSHADIDQALDDTSITVPRKAIDALCRVAKKSDAVQLEVDASRLIASAGDSVVEARLLAGAFPRWREALPEGADCVTSAVAGELLAACKMASVVSSPESRGVVFSFDDDELTLSGKSAEFGTSSVKCELIETAAKRSVCIDPTGVMSWLDSGSLDSSEPISIRIDASSGAIVFSSGDYVHKSMALVQ